MMASDTPLTDAALYAIPPGDTWTKYDWVPAQFAQKLERDLSAARAECIEQARLNGIGAERELKLMAEIERLRKDAERYRWLREGFCGNCVDVHELTLDADEMTHGQFDAAVDAAIAREGRE
jgi:hypothetical protein